MGKQFLSGFRLKIPLSQSSEITGGDQTVGNGDAPTDGKDDPENNTVKNGFQSQFFDFIFAEIGADEEQGRHHKIL